MTAYAVPIDGSPPSTAHWTARIARGDTAAFSAFYEAWFDRVFALAQSFSRRDESFCLDVVQDAMLRVVKSMPTLEHESQVSAWLTRAVYSATIDQIRAEQRRTLREQRVAEATPEAHTRDPAESLLTDEKRAWIAARLSELPERDRELVLARFEGSMTLEQVGATFAMSGSAAHGRIRRIVDRLRSAAERWFHDE